MLVTSIFSFSQNVFKKPLPHGLLKSGLCGKELTSNPEFWWLEGKEVLKVLGEKKFSSLLFLQYFQLFDRENFAFF